jgi:predicted DNA-binding protein YlxM (UPF0122 family)
MEKIVKQALLYDFYGELLTPHQREIYEAAIGEDMSLGEIADEQSISRQGVHDVIKRCDRILQSYEDTLHMIERFHITQEKIQTIKTLTDIPTPYRLSYDDILERLVKIRQLSDELCDLE